MIYWSDHGEKILEVDNLCILGSALNMSIRGKSNKERQTKKKQ